MKYKIGDKVMVRPDLSQCDNLRFRTNGIMESLAGQTVTITGIVYILGMGLAYRINEDHEFWVWSDEMFSDIQQQKISLLDLIDSLR